MSDNKRQSLDLCLPVYNEATILRSNVQRVIEFIQQSDLGVDCRLVILVNGSTDRSAKIAKELAQAWPKLVAYHVYGVAGKSRTLMDYADLSQADWWGFMDIDLAVDLASLPQLMRPIIEQSADLVIASRFLPESRRSRSWWRETVSATYNWLARRVLGTSVGDHQCGCKFIRRAWWQSIRPQLGYSNWFLDTELIAWTTKQQGRIVEVPVGWVDNRYQVRPTKVHLVRDIFDFLIGLNRLRRRLRA